MADTQLPLLGVIMCCTSIPPEQRSDLAAIASQMGATHRLDLTSDVTHLIVGDPDTPKYKFVARERLDVKCMLPSWIDSLRTKWLEGGEINVEDLEQEHKLPTFYGLRVCVTGFDDLEYRKRLEDHITDNGGEYRGNLTKDITHLIAKEASGQKYNYAAQWSIKTVAVEWLDHSLERGMILDESLYHLALPVLERGRNAWIRRTPSTTSLGKRSREQDLGSGNARKLRRTASAKLSSQNLGLWADINILGSKPGESKKDEWHEDNHGVVNIDGAKAKRPEFERGQLVKVEDETKAAKTKLDFETSLPSDRLQKTGIFQDKTFILNGFDDKKTSVLEGHLSSHGAQIIPNIDDYPDSEPSCNLFHLVPHTTRKDDVQIIRIAQNVPIVVTELWVERCLFRKKFEEPEQSIINTPFQRFPIIGFEEMSICSTAFQGIDLLHMSKAVKLMGASYEEVFTPNASVLVCNAVASAHEKLRHAQIWGVPAVTAEWLRDCIRSGETQPLKSYLVQTIRDLSNDPAQAKPAAALSGPARAPKMSEDKLKVPEKWVPKPLIKTSLSEDARNQFAKDAPGRRELANINKMFDLNIFSDLPTKLLLRDENQTPIYLDDDNTPLLLDDSNTTLDPHQISPPLREITPNSSPPRAPPSPIKHNPPSSSPPRKPSEDPTLGSAISSLLAHHQRTNSAAARPPSSESTDQPRMYRRRRQLLGRAPSNLSSHSINLSRASSVDTMNTDGLGTPLEASSRSKSDLNLVSSNLNSSKPKAEFPTFYSADQNDDPDRAEPMLQMTQLGYEDPDVAAWRERVAVKMAGGKVKDKTGTTPGKSKGIAGAGSLGIAKRTRLATGGR